MDKKKKGSKKRSSHDSEGENDKHIVNGKMVKEKHTMPKAKPKKKAK